MTSDLTTKAAEIRARLGGVQRQYACPYATISQDLLSQTLALIEQQADELAEARREHRNIQTALAEETARTIAAIRERDEARTALQVAKDGWRDAEASAAALKSERDERLREKERLGAVLDAAAELADLMDDTVGGSYTPDSFTTQPIRLALSALENGPAGLADAHSKSPAPSSQSERIAVLEECAFCANTGWMYSEPDLGRCGCGRTPALAPLGEE